MWLGEHMDPEWFPPLDQALREPQGLIAAGGDLQPARLLAAYERGIFPWYSAQQPILWWAPDPRMVLFPGEFKCSRSLARPCAAAPFTPAWIRRSARPSARAPHRAGRAPTPG